MLLIKNLQLPNQKMISWDWDGQPVHLQGANGVGKSLFLKAIASLYPTPYEDFKFKNIPRDKMNPQLYRSQVIYVSSQLSMTSFETAYDFYTAPLNLQIYKDHSYPSELESKLREWKILDKRCSDLSSGEKQILNLIRVLSLRPQVVLIDEAFTNLDSSRKDWILTFLHQKFQSSQFSYVVVSHEIIPQLSLNQLDFSQLQTPT